MTDTIPSAAREALVTAEACRLALNHWDAQLLQLARRVPGGARDYGLIRSKLSKLVSQIMATVPPEQLRTIARQMEISRIQVATVSAAGHLDDQWVCERGDIELLAQLAANNVCLTCDKPDYGCKLRKIILGLPLEDINTFLIPCMR